MSSSPAAHKRTQADGCHTCGDNNKEETTADIVQILFGEFFLLGYVHCLLQLLLGHIETVFSAGVDDIGQSLSLVDLLFQFLIQNVFQKSLSYSKLDGVFSFVVF